MLLVTLKFRSNSIESNHQYDWKCILSIAAVCVDGARSDTITMEPSLNPSTSLPLRWRFLVSRLRTKHTIDTGCSTYDPIAVFLILLFFGRN